MPGCTFCDPYCYDHALEWGLQGRHILSPVITRVTQRPGAGMTYKENEVRQIYSGYVRATEFRSLRLPPWELASRFIFTAPGHSAVHVQTSEVDLSIEMARIIAVVLMLACLAGCMCRMASTRCSQRRRALKAE